MSAATVPECVATPATRRYGRKPGSERTQKVNLLALYSSLTGEPIGGGAVSKSSVMVGACAAGASTTTAHAMPAKPTHRIAETSRRACYAGREPTDKPDLR